MAFKSLTFTLEITVGTFNEDAQSRETVSEFLEAIDEGTKQFVTNISSETGGVFVGNAKLLKHSEDWQ